MRFRKKPIVIDAELFIEPDKAIGVHPYPVPLWRRMLWFKLRTCRKCNLLLSRHGWIETLEGGHIACPGDWIITGVKGEKYPCKSDIFAATYEPVQPERRQETPQ